MEPLYPLIILL